MKKSNLLSRAEMRNVMGGLAAGRCVLVTCNSGATSCWYSKRTAGELSTDVCDSNIGNNSLEGVDCDQFNCTMN